MTLQVDGISAGYGATQVLFDVSLSVGPGQVLAVLGRNGMGKTTTVCAIMGLLPCWIGAIGFAGRPLTGLPPYGVARRGLGLVPKGGKSFPLCPLRRTWSPPPPAAPGRHAGHWSASGRCSPACANGGATWAAPYPAASSRCWRSAAR